MFKSKDWKRTSITNGKSTAFNQDKFSKGKRVGHYTDDMKERMANYLIQ